MGIVEDPMSRSLSRFVRTFGSVSGCLMLLAGLSFGPLGCATAPSSDRERQALVDESQAAVSRFKAEDQSLDAFLNNAYGYAVFPNAGKGGFIAGGAYGRGTVYEQGRMIGYADMSQATVGLQAGGQSFSELIVFQDQKALDRFINNRLEFAANASAVALKAGAAASARYTDGVAVFTHAKGGLMVEAAIGGQRFTFRRAEDSRQASWQQNNANGGTSAGASSSASSSVSESSTPPSVASPSPAAAPSAAPSVGPAASPTPGESSANPLSPSPAAPTAAPTTAPTTLPSTGG